MVPGWAWGPPAMSVLNSRNVAFMFLPRNGQRIGSVSTYKSLSLTDQMLDLMPYHENERLRVEFPHDWLNFLCTAVYREFACDPCVG
jgi:hypothetical protein